jgi:hypothetical protein
VRLLSGLDNIIKDIFYKGHILLVCMKGGIKILTLAVVLVGFLLIGVYNNSWSITGHALDSSDSSGVSRLFAGNEVDENIVVTISVYIEPGFDHSVYVIEEEVPNGFSIVDTGSATVSGNVLKWSDVNEGGVSSIELTYAVRTSDIGSYSFDGQYVIDGMDIEGVISNSELSVIGVDNEAPTSNYNINRPVRYSSSDLTIIDFNWEDNVGIRESYVEADFSGSFMNYSGGDWSGILGAGSYIVRGWAVDESGNWAVTSFYPFEILKGDSNLMLSLNGVDGQIDIGVGKTVNVVANAEKEFGLYLNGNEIFNGNNIFNSLIPFPQEGFNVLRADVLEDANYNSYTVTRLVNVSSLISGASAVVWDHSRWDGITTNFSNINLNSFSCAFANEFGGIRFLENLSASRDLDFSGVNISANRIYVDSVSLPELNESAELKFYGLSFVDPRVLRNGVVCLDCVEKSYANGILTVDVDSFSEYITEESYVTPEDSGDDSDSGSGDDSDSGSGGRSNSGGSFVTIPLNGEVSCVEDYICGSWSGCKDGLMSRECVDASECGVDRIEEESCIEEEAPWVLELGLSVMWWTLIILISFIVIVLGWISFKIGGIGLRGLGR